MTSERQQVAVPSGVTAGRELWRAVGLSMGPLVVLGMARFAYALLLPSMRADLGWSYTRAGNLNAANAVGYLLGAVAAVPLNRAAGARTAFLGGLVLTAACLLGCAATTSFALLAMLRLGAGAAGAVAFVAGAGLAVQAGAHLRPGRAAVLLGIFVAGGGSGILLSGAGIPPLLATLGPGLGWRAGWLLLGLASLVAVVPAATATRGLRPPPAEPPGERRAWERQRLGATTIAYLLFGMGYIGYMTFVVAVLRSELDAAQIAVFWMLLGAASIGASFWWGPVLGRARGGRGLAVLLAVVAVGAAVPLLAAGPVAAFGSAVLFGGSFLSTVTAVTVVARRNLPPYQWGAAIGGLTVAFAAGQCVGPVLAGVLSDQASGVRAGLAASAIVLAVGAAVALAQPDHHRGQEA